MLSASKTTQHRSSGICNILLTTTFLTLAAAHTSHAAVPMVEDVSKQPLMVHVERVLEALDFIGRPLSNEDRARILEAAQQADAQAVRTIQEIVDKNALVAVVIDPQRKLEVMPAAAGPETLVKNGWTTFLVKVINQAGVTDTVDVDSPQAAMPYDFSRMQVERSVYEDQFTDVMLEKHFHIGTTWGGWGGGYPYKEPPQPEQERPLAAARRPFLRADEGPLDCRQPLPGRQRSRRTCPACPWSTSSSRVYSRDEGPHSMTLSFNVGALRSSGTGSVPTYRAIPASAAKPTRLQRPGGGAGHLEDLGRAGATDRGQVHHPRQDRPGLPVPFEAVRPRSVLSEPHLPVRRAKRSSYLPANTPSTLRVAPSTKAATEGDHTAGLAVDGAFRPQTVDQSRAPSATSASTSMSTRPVASTTTTRPTGSSPRTCSATPSAKISTSPTS